jgi:hypothetical protein
MCDSRCNTLARLAPLAASLLVALLATSCDPVLRPRTNALRDLQRAAGADTGTLTGAVYVVPAGWPDTANIWLAPRIPVPGAIVELGLWSGEPATFRDSLGDGPPTDLHDARFTVVAQVITDKDAKWRVAGLPRKTPFALRVVPPAGIAAQPAYLGTLFWLYQSSTMDLPLVLRRASSTGT